MYTHTHTYAHPLHTGMFGLNTTTTDADVVVPSTNAATTNMAPPKWAAARVQPTSSTVPSPVPNKNSRGGTGSSSYGVSIAGALPLVKAPGQTSGQTSGQTAAVGSGSGSVSSSGGGGTATTEGGGDDKGAKGGLWGSLATNLLYQGLKLTANAVTVCGVGMCVCRRVCV